LHAPAFRGYKNIRPVEAPAATPDAGVPAASKLMTMSPKNLLLTLSTLLLVSCAQAGDDAQVKGQATKANNQPPMQNKMKIEIWSDVMCPFCYIGTRKFEAALAQTSVKDRIEIVWKSFLLAPDMKTRPCKNINQFLAEHKGIPVQQAEAMHAQVTAMAKGVGLQYNMDKVVVASSVNAHRFAHFAKGQGKGAEAEEALFRAYFTEGKNIDDFPTLIQIGTSLGLDGAALKAALEGGAFADAVQADIAEARQIGVNGVPFFVFNRKYAVSGAQDPKTFSEVIEKAFSEWQAANPGALEVISGPACTPAWECK
jgi:protein disulfide-isomerase